MSKTAAAAIMDMGLTRVAGNVFVAPFGREFWRLDGGRIIRMGGDEIEDKDAKLPAAPSNDPESYLREVMAEIDFN